MENFSQFVIAIFDSRELLFGKGSHADQLGGFKSFDDSGEVSVAGLCDGFHAVAGEFIRGDVCAGVFHPDEGTEVGNEVVGEEGVS